MPQRDSEKGFTHQKVQESGTYRTEGGDTQTYVVGDEFNTHPRSGKRVVWSRVGDDKRLGDAH